MEHNPFLLLQSARSLEASELEPLRVQLLEQLMLLQRGLENSDFSMEQKAKLMAWLRHLERHFVFLKLEKELQALLRRLSGSLFTEAKAPHAD